MRYATLAIALAIALATGTAARAGGEPALHLAVHGSLDGDAIADALGKELDIDVEVVEDRCDLPCLDVAIDGKFNATVVYVPRTGAARQRSIALGSDAAQWPVVITLLAGNVVRDEAQDVLAGLPSRDLDVLPGGQHPGDVPPAPEAPVDPYVAPPPPVALPPPAIAVAPEVRVAAPPAEHRWLGIGFVPGISTDLPHVGSVRHFLSLNVLVGLGSGSSGLSMSGIADIERGLVGGFQVAGLVALGRQVAGTQAAGIAAVAGDLDGVQVGGIAAVADRVDGVQLGGIASVAGSNADYQGAGIASFARGNTVAQAAGIASVAGGTAAFQAGGIASVARGGAGIQLGGVAAASGGDANFQAGGVTSVARGTANIQLAGVVNVARRVRGLQIAPINVAREVDGMQVGVINVGGSRDGFSFGLINIVPGGRYDLEAAVDSDQIGTVLFRHGGRRWHNVYGFGGHSVDERGPTDDVWMYGLGFGPTLEFGNTVMDLELIGWQVNHGARHETDDVSILGQLRLSVAHHWGPFAVVVGGMLNTYVTSDTESPLYVERRADDAPMETGVTVTVWPSAFVGLRI